MSKLQKVQKKKLSHSHAVSNTAKFLQTRPFAEIGDSTKSLQTQLVEASNLRHNFGDLQVQPNSSPVVQPKLTIGEPGDKYEQEADKNKTQINQKSGISSIQRDLINENAKDQINGLDTVYELIAHKIAYKGIDGIPGTMGDWLDAQGYQRNWQFEQF